MHRKRIVLGIWLTLVTSMVLACSPHRDDADSTVVGASESNSSEPTTEPDVRQRVERRTLSMGRSFDAATSDLTASDASRDAATGDGGGDDAGLLDAEPDAAVVDAGAAPDAHGGPQPARPVALACPAQNAPLWDPLGQPLYDACISDSDCASDQACQCGRRDGQAGPADTVNHCVKAACHVDSDCGSSGTCGYNLEYVEGICGNENGSAEGFYCHTPNDVCKDDSDCLIDADISYMSPCLRAENTLWQCLVRYNYYSKQHCEP